MPKIKIQITQKWYFSDVNIATMNRMDRLLGMLTLLQSKKYVTAEKIAATYDISVRTVYRDIKALIEQGIPISFEPSRGYFIVKEYFLPPVSLTTEEANAILITESLVKGFTDQSIQQHFATAMQKVKAVLRHHQKEKLESLNDNIMLQIPEGYKLNMAFMSLLQQAITDKQQVSITYTNKEDSSSDRSIEPIGLIFYAFNWHLIAWCHKRTEYRDFRLSRIKEVKLLGKAFIKQDHIGLNDYIKELPVDY